MLHRWVKLQDLSDEVAWELVSALFSGRRVIFTGGFVYVAFGLMGAISSGHWIYTAGTVYAALVTTWRLFQVVGFRSRQTDDRPTAWAVKGMRSAWATAAGWGGLSTLAAIETEPRLVGILFGIHAAIMTGGAVLNSSVSVIAQGQVLLAGLPLWIACLIAGDLYSRFYAAMLLVQMCVTLALITTLNKAKLRTLCNEVQALELSAKLAVANEELEVVNQHLKQQVATDPLTGLLNRRAFDLAAAREWRAAMREERALCVLMVDVDHFKSYNDFYGHQAGDVCLCDIAAILSTVVQRPGDILARYGGEEFIAILPSTTTEGAEVVADRVLEALAERALPHGGSPLGRISVSIGVASAIITPSRLLTMLVEAADQALYEAKRGGRNRVAVRAEELDWTLPDPVAGDHSMTQLFLYDPASSHR